MSHKEWQQSILDQDGRHWILEERNGIGHYIEVTPDDKTNPYRTGEGPAAIRNRKAREQMKKRVSKEVKPFTWRLGYNTCVGQWTGGDEYPQFSGSSLNRSLRAKPKPEKKEPSAPAIHLFSKRSRGKVKDKATAFFRAAQQQRAFVTLTFIEDVDDRRGVKILNKFLTVLRKERPGLEYLWVAEHQEERKERTIHFHMIVNRRLPIKRYNALWTLQQYNEGLVGHHANGELISKQEIEKRYQHDITSKFKKKDPDSVQAVLNPFDIEEAYNIYGLGKYLTQYITKQADKDPFGCLNWHCSRKVSKLFTKEVVSPSTFRYMCSLANVRINFDTGQCWTPKPLAKQFFTMVYVNNKGAPLRILGQMEQINKWIIKKFQPDRLPMLTDVLYRKLLYNERQEALDAAIHVPGISPGPSGRKSRVVSRSKGGEAGKAVQSKSSSTKKEK